jgi:DNA-binding transcriptional regulator YdaS (Cro superfamily)
MAKHSDPLLSWKRDHGGNTGLATKLNEINPKRSLTPQAISQWRQVPADRVIDVETATGISRHVLRPDLSMIFISGGEAA